MTQKFPILYKKTNLGAMQQWRVWVEEATIHTEFGQVNGKLQTTKDTILEGKNAGKANETTVIDQAEKEAASKFQKQLKKGYCTSEEDALANKTDAVIEGGIFPMLSINKSHPKDPILNKYLKFPCIVQAKLDGVCCIAMIKDGKATLWSRTRKSIKSMPHIVEILESKFGDRGYLVLHGELYNHDYCDRFQDLISIIRSDEPDEEGLYKEVQFHVYDCPQSEEFNIAYESPYEDRYHAYRTLLGKTDKGSVLQSVKGYWCDNLQELLTYYEGFLLDGYEGSMAKNARAPYEAGKRSSNILKMKEFQDGEALVAGMEVGRGKECNAAAKFVVQYSVVDGVCVPPAQGKVVYEAKPRMKCSFKDKVRYLKEKDAIVGKIITLVFKRFTDDNSLYIPTGKSIRDYE